MSARYAICPACGVRAKIEYGTRLREHHQPTGYICGNYSTAPIPDGAPLAYVPSLPTPAPATPPDNETCPSQLQGGAAERGGGPARSSHAHDTPG